MYFIVSKYESMDVCLTDNQLRPSTSFLPFCLLLECGGTISLTQVSDSTPVHGENSLSPVGFVSWLTPFTLCAILLFVGFPSSYFSSLHMLA